MAHMIMGYDPGLAWLERQAPLGAIKRLDL
jgi:hypothetical protein